MSYMITIRANDPSGKFVGKLGDGVNLAQDVANTLAQQVNTIFAAQGVQWSATAQQSGASATAKGGTVSE